MRLVTGHDACYGCAASTLRSDPDAAPVHSAEQKAIGATVSSDYCCRKKFYCPPDARKMFISFGAIMQTATVYVNGTSKERASLSAGTANSGRLSVDYKSLKRQSQLYKKPFSLIFGHSC